VKPARFKRKSFFENVLKLLEILLKICCCLVQRCSVQVKLPLTHLDLAGLSDLSASVDVSALDSLLAVSLPCLLALLALPVCLARAAMLGLDCIAVRTQVHKRICCEYIFES
jgi:hypothetical protein